MSPAWVAASCLSLLPLWFLSCVCSPLFGSLQRLRLREADKWQVHPRLLVPSINHVPELHHRDDIPQQHWVSTGRGPSWIGKHFLNHDLQALGKVSGAFRLKSALISFWGTTRTKWANCGLNDQTVTFRKLSWTSKRPTRRRFFWIVSRMWRNVKVLQQKTGTSTSSSRLDRLHLLIKPAVSPNTASCFFIIIF